MTTPNSEQWTTQALGLVQQGQDAAMKLVGELSEALTAAVPGGSRGAGPGGGLGALIPGGPAEIVDRLYDTGIQVLEAQRAMAHGVLEAAGPALQAFGAPDGARGR